MRGGGGGGGGGGEQVSFGVEPLVFVEYFFGKQLHHHIMKAIRT